MCIQYVNDAFRVRSISVGKFGYTGKHTAEALHASCEGPGSLVELWGLQNFKCVYTTDSYTTNVAAYKYLDSIVWVPCTAHAIHNTIKHDLIKGEQVNRLHKKCTGF